MARSVSDLLATLQAGQVLCHDGKLHAITAVTEEVLRGLQKTFRRYSVGHSASRDIYRQCADILLAEMDRRGLKVPVRQALIAGMDLTCVMPSCERVAHYVVGGLHGGQWCAQHRRIALLHKHYQDCAYKRRSRVASAVHAGIERDRKERDKQRQFGSALRYPKR